MSTDIASDIDAVMTFIRREFSFGNDKVSAEDDIGDGRELGDVVADIADAISSGGFDDIDPLVVAAIRCMDGIIGGGFELIDAEDAIPSGATLSEISRRYVAIRGPAVGP